MDIWIYDFIVCLNARLNIYLFKNCQVTNVMLFCSLYAYIEGTSAVCCHLDSQFLSVTLDVVFFFFHFVV